MYQKKDNLMHDPMDGHQCQKIAQIIPCGPGREVWMGRLLEPIPGYESETHCLHITTPAKSVAFGVTVGDMCLIAVLAQIAHERPINQRWLNSMEKVMRWHGEHDVKESSESHPTPCQRCGKPMREIWDKESGKTFWHCDECDKRLLSAFLSSKSD